MNLRLLLAAAAAALVSTSAQAANIFYQSFTDGLTAQEQLGGDFTVMNGRVGHTDGGYRNYEYSYYQLSLDLTDYLDAQLLFDYDIFSEYRYDGLNVVASTTGAFNPPAGLLTPISTGFYGQMYGSLSRLGSQAVSGDRRGTVVFDLTQFAGGKVDLRFQFQSDYAAIGRGVLLDNVIVNGEPVPGTAVPEPATWAMMILGFGAAGSILRRRRLVAA